MDAKDIILGTWKNPYTLKNKFKTILGFQIRRFAIVFEEQELFDTNDKFWADRYCGALNGAYNLGRWDAVLDIENINREEKEKKEKKKEDK